MFYTKVVQEIKTQVLCPKAFFFENLAAYEIMWKRYGRATQVTDDSIIRRMRIACWIIRARNTHSEYVTLTAFPHQQQLAEYITTLH
jgi:hypothetical protein